MTAREFEELFQDIIQGDDPVAIDAELADIVEWDSMAMMALIAHFGAKLGVAVTFDQLRKLRTVRDVAALVPGFEA